MELLAAHYEAEQNYLKLIVNAKKEARATLTSKIVSEKDRNPFKCTVKDVFNELNTTKMAQSTYLKKVKKEDRANDPLLSEVTKVCKERAQKRAEWEKTNSTINGCKASKEKVATEIETLEARIKVVAHALTVYGNPVQREPTVEVSRAPQVPAVEAPRAPQVPAVEAPRALPEHTVEVPQVPVIEATQELPVLRRKSSTSDMEHTSVYEDLPGCDILERIQNGEDF